MANIKAGKKIGKDGRWKRRKSKQERERRGLQGPAIQMHSNSLNKKQRKVCRIKHQG